MADRRERLRDALLGAPWDGMQRGQATGTLRNAPPMSLREKIMDLIVGGGRAAGFSATQANRMRNDAGAAVDFIPGVGDAVGADDAVRDYRAGNYGAAALGAGAAAVGLIPGVGDAASAGIKKGIKAYHGSPHDFGKFSMDKIGTGEGAQAYGHGLYFADKEGVAKSYRDALGGRAADKSDASGTLGGRAFSVLTPEERHAVRMARDWKDPAKAAEVAESQGLSERASLLRRMASGELPYTINKGHMYEVNINANPDEFLDWDAPLREQPGVASKFGWSPDEIAAHKARQSQNDDRLLAALTGDAQYEEVKPPRDMSNRPKLDWSGGQFYESSRLVPGDYRDKEAAANKLREAGIPGIKYLDQGSRAAGDGSRNYVVFDDKLIDIVRKYGLGAAIASGVISAEMGRQMQEQGDI